MGMTTWGMTILQICSMMICLLHTSAVREEFCQNILDGDGLRNVMGKRSRDITLGSHRRPESFQCKFESID